MNDELVQLHQWALELAAQAARYASGEGLEEGAPAFEAWLSAPTGVGGFLSELLDAEAFSKHSLRVHDHVLRAVPVRYRPLLRDALESAVYDRKPQDVLHALTTVGMCLGAGLATPKPDPAPAEAAHVGWVLDGEAMVGRVVGVHVNSLRCIDDILLEVDRLCVLIGENGAGKSTLLTALEILSRIPTERHIDNYLSRHHKGLGGLLRHGTDRVVLGVVLRFEALEVSYAVVFGHGERGGAAIIYEHIALKREEDTLKLVEGYGPDSLLFSVGSDPLLAYWIKRVAASLESIQVHVPFYVVSGWVGESMHKSSKARSASVLQPATRLERFADNLSNAFFTLKNNRERAHWEETLSLVRLGLGAEVEDVHLNPDPGGGQIALVLVLRGGRVPLWGMSDGMVSYLAFVALVRLASECALLAFDEPETHMHPALLVRVLEMFKRLSEDVPVVLATHSGVVLDALDDPAASVVLMDLGPGLRTRLMRPDPEVFGAWLEEFGGLSRLRAEGLERAVMKEVGA